MQISCRIQNADYNLRLQASLHESFSRRLFGPPMNDLFSSDSFNLDTPKVHEIIQFLAVSLVNHNNVIDIARKGFNSLKEGRSSRLNMSDRFV